MTSKQRIYLLLLIHLLIGLINFSWFGTHTNLINALGTVLYIVCWIACLIIERNSLGRGFYIFAFIFWILTFIFFVFALYLTAGDGTNTDSLIPFGIVIASSFSGLGYLTASKTNLDSAWYLYAAILSAAMGLYCGIKLVLPTRIR